MQATKSLRTVLSRRLRTLVAVLALGLCGLAGSAVAYSTGPDPDKVGLCSARATCRDSLCHDSYPLNSGDAVSILELEGGPLPPTPTYDLDALMRFVVSVVDPTPDRRRMGFQLGVVSDCPFADNAGTLTLVEPQRTLLTTGNRVTFVSHTCFDVIPPQDPDQCGYVPPVPGQISWTFDWRAPSASVGPITLYWAINSADGDSTPAGDFISLWEQTLVPNCPARLDTLRATKTACDPGQPGVPKAELTWQPVAGFPDYRLYRTADATALADPEMLGADLLSESCDDPGVGAVYFYTVVGVCLDASSGPV